jgi:uncharacterized membrane protein
MIKKFIFAGILVWLPIIATVWIIKFLVNLFDQLITIIPVKYQPDTLLGIHIPGLGIILAVIIVLLTGILVTNFLGRQIMLWLDIILKRVPIIGPLYNTIKQVLNTIMSSDGKSFHKVLLIEYPREGLWSIALQTSEASEQLNKAADQKEMLAAFIPTTPNPTSGFLVMVPKEKARELDMSVDQAFKIIVSLGTLSINDAKVLEKIK